MPEECGLCVLAMCLEPKGGQVEERGWADGNAVPCGRKEWWNLLCHAFILSLFSILLVASLPNVMSAVPSSSPMPPSFVWP